MKLAYLPKEFQQAQGVLALLQNHGFEAYFVGGSVRDALLGKAIHDVDIATSAYPEEIKELFPKTVDVGIDHGTVLVLFEGGHYELTTFRTESTYQDYRRPDAVTFVRSLKEDLKRRDFTINALAMDQTGEIIDLFDGMNDLSEKVIRAVGNPKERFHEDALRMMRGLRFASQLAFSIENQTLSAIQAFHPLLKKISVERISIEFTKLLLGKNRQAGLLPFIETECYQYCPELREYGAQLLAFCELPNTPLGKEEDAWALLVYVLAIPKNQWVSFLKAWKLSNQLIHRVQDLVNGLAIRLDRELQRKELYILGLEKAESIENLLVFFNQEPAIKKLQTEYQQLPITNRRQLAITGTDLLHYSNKKPGKWVGTVLDQLELLVLDGDVPNDNQSLLVVAATLVDKE